MTAFNRLAIDEDDYSAVHACELVDGDIFLNGDRVVQELSDDLERVEYLIVKPNGDHAVVQFIAYEMVEVMS